MNAVRSVAVRVAALVVASPAACWGANCLLNPVTTYTNGMPLASSSSLRSHNVYWQGDPYRVGECDGRYNCPCLNEFHYRRGVMIGDTEPLVGQAERMPDGLEAETGVVLGVVSIDPSAVRRDATALTAAPAPAAAAVAPTSPQAGGVWLDALQSLQRKIMIDPDKGY